MDNSSDNLSTLKSHGELMGQLDSPLIVLVHGRGGNINIMRVFTRCIPSNWNMLFVEAPYPDLQVGGMSWWDVSERPFPWGVVEDSSNLLVSEIDRFVEQHNLQPTYTIALGFSQGSALITYSILTQKLKLDGVGILAGFCLCPPEFPQLLETKPDIFWAHGTNDDIVPIEKAHEGIQTLTDLSLSVEFHSEDVGHKIGSASMRALKEWLSKFDNRDNIHGR